MTSSETCPMCGGRKQPGYTTYSVDLGDGLVVVRHVPATVYDQCGEEWIDNQKAQRLEAIIEEAVPKIIRLKYFLCKRQTCYDGSLFANTDYAGAGQKKTSW